MNINAKYFGSTSYEENEVLYIPNGLIGFESYTRYIPLAFQDEDDSMLSLQSLDDEELSFILMNPFKMCPGYAPELPSREMKALEAGSDKELAYYVLCVVRDPITNSTVNLKAPLVINTANNHARQVILDQPEYTFRHTLSDFMNKEG